MLKNENVIHVTDAFWLSLSGVHVILMKIQLKHISYINFVNYSFSIIPFFTSTVTGK